MSSKKWVVWSLSRKDGTGLVVNEGTERQAREAAERKNAAARRQKLADAAFIALPKGRQPVNEDLPPAQELPAESGDKPEQAPRKVWTGDKTYEIHEDEPQGKRFRFSRLPAVEIGEEDCIFTVPDGWSLHHLVRSLGRSVEVVLEEKPS